MGVTFIRFPPPTTCDYDSFFFLNLYSYIVLKTYINPNDSYNFMEKEILKDSLLQNIGKGAIRFFVDQTWDNLECKPVETKSQVWPNKISIALHNES